MDSPEESLQGIVVHVKQSVGPVASVIFNTTFVPIISLVDWMEMQKNTLMGDMQQPEGDEEAVEQWDFFRLIPHSFVPNLQFTRSRSSYWLLVCLFDDTAWQ